MLGTGIHGQGAWRERERKREEYTVRASRKGSDKGLGIERGNSKAEQEDVRCPGWVKVVW